MQPAAPRSSLQQGRSRGPCSSWVPFLVNTKAFLRGKRRYRKTDAEAIAIVEYRMRYTLRYMNLSFKAINESRNVHSFVHAVLGSCRIVNQPFNGEEWLGRNRPLPKQSHFFPHRPSLEGLSAQLPEDISQSHGTCRLTPCRTCYYAQRLLGRRYADHASERIVHRRDFRVQVNSNNVVQVKPHC